MQLKVRYAGFRTITRSRTLREPTDLAVDIAAVASALLHDVPDLEVGVRLIGVSMQQLAVPAPSPQPNLFSPGIGAGAEEAQGEPTPPVSPPAERGALERTIDAVRARFGQNAVGPGAPRVEQTPAVRENGDA